MSLYFKKISLYNFRNHQDETIEFDPGVTILHGPNASGKTNTIEALQLLTAGLSFRKPSPRELITINNENARIEGFIKGDDRNLEVKFTCLPFNR